MKSINRRLFICGSLSLLLTGCATTQPGNVRSASMPARLDDQMRASDPARYDALFETATAQSIAFSPRYPTGSIVVDKSRNRLYLVNAKGSATSFAVALGKKGWETPTDRFRVWRKDEWPVYNSVEGYSIQPGLDNPIGARQIGIMRNGRIEGFYIHGTNRPELIGNDVSHGCIRMHNADVLYLYNRVGKNTAVYIEDRVDLSPASAPGSSVR